jgi:hypothetical protein
MTGNVWAGGNEPMVTLRQLFTADITVARGRCANCGQEGATTDSLIFDQAPGLVSRCPSCESVLFRVVRGPDRAWLDMRGLVCLEFAVPDETTPS